MVFIVFVIPFGWLLVHLEIGCAGVEGSIHEFGKMRNMGEIEGGLHEEVVL